MHERILMTAARRFHQAASRCSHLTVRRLTRSVGGIGVLAALSLAACNQSNPADSTESAKGAQQSTVPELSIDAVSDMVAGKTCTPVDANRPETRAEFGILPGAVLLSDYHDFKPGELPSDKNTKLVFYCGGEKCTAAPNAAKLAAQAGYTDVSVMRAGIRGWVAAGKSVVKPST